MQCALSASPDPSDWHHMYTYGSSGSPEGVEFMRLNSKAFNGMEGCKSPCM